MKTAILALLVLAGSAHAGPPYTTDDPEPVKYRHWEFYLATQDTSTSSESSGTGPHVEINYGVVPNVQLHAIVPLAYDHADAPTSYGVGDIELGTKVRFVQEAGKRPMVGVFPLLELPVGNESKGLGTGHLRAFLPVWLQSSSGPWQSYGGGGYWINPGTGNRNYWLFGWQLQRELTKGLNLGAELYYTTPDEVGGDADLSFNVGIVLDVTDHHHLLVSAGRSIVGETIFQSYLAYQLTI
jgi:Putative MetA-pathway of phenol degradation